MIVSKPKLRKQSSRKHPAKSGARRVSVLTMTVMLAVGIVAVVVLLRGGELTGIGSPLPSPAAPGAHPAAVAVVPTRGDLFPSSPTAALRRHVRADELGRDAAVPPEGNWGVRCRRPSTLRAKREEAVQDAWLGPEMKLGGLQAIHNLQMNPGEPYDMVFNGAAQPPPAKDGGHDEQVVTTIPRPGGGSRQTYSDQILALTMRSTSP